MRKKNVSEISHVQNLEQYLVKGVTHHHLFLKAESFILGRDERIEQPLAQDGSISSFQDEEKRKTPLYLKENTKVHLFMECRLLCKLPCKFCT